MTDMETLYKYYDAVRTGDPDRQVNDGVDIEALEFAIQRIAEIEKQIETGISAYADLLGNSMNEIRELGEQLKAIKETQSAEVHELKERLDVITDNLKNAIKYDKDLNLYIVVWTKREIEKAKEEAEELAKFFNAPIVP